MPDAGVTFSRLEVRGMQCSVVDISGTCDYRLDQHGDDNCQDIWDECSGNGRYKAGLPVYHEYLLGIG